jgi:hypothetical protein
MTRVCELCSSPFYARGFCVKHYQVEYYHRFPEKCRKKTLKWVKLDRKKNPEKYKLSDKKRYQAGKKTYLAYERKHHDKRKIQKRLIMRKHREDLIKFMGGKCIKCGFNDIRALQVDHINGGGCKERKAIGLATFYHNVRIDPKKYQLLCANCNWIKRWENNENTGPRTKVIKK